MKRTRLFSKITAMALVAIMACCMFASAYEGRKQTLYGDNGEYIGHSTLYVDGTRANGGVFLKTSDNRYVDPGMLRVRATLAYADNGAVFYSSEIKENTRSYYFVDTTTTYRPALRTACSVGLASFEDLPYFMQLPTCYVGDNYTRSSDIESQLDALAERTLIEGNAYPVNAAGETYGSILLADKVGKGPDLIYAVNQDDVYGYIRYEDIMNANPVCSRAAIPAFTLYDVDGNVIGDFELGESESSTIDTPDFEAAQAEMCLAQ